MRIWRPDVAPGSRFRTCARQDQRRLLPWAFIPSSWCASPFCPCPNDPPPPHSRRPPTDRHPCLPVNPAEDGTGDSEHAAAGQSVLAAPVAHGADSRSSLGCWRSRVSTTAWARAGASVSRSYSSCVGPQCGRQSGCTYSTDGLGTPRRRPLAAVHVRDRRVTRALSLPSRWSMCHMQSATMMS